MQRSEYRDEGRRRTAETSRVAKDVETWLGNTLALIFSALAVAGAVIGWFVAMGYLSTAQNLTDFEGGMVWFVGAIVLGIVANVFRREHHIVDADTVDT